MANELELLARALEMTQTEVVIILLAILGVYFIPTIVAFGRGHRNTVAIVILNIFLGWTFLGWVAALVWACTNNREGSAA